MSKKKPVFFLIFILKNIYTYFVHKNIYIYFYAYGLYFFDRGIPYAEPPIEELRWADPVPILEQWPSSTVDGRADKHFCPQYDHDIKEMVGNEDCLYLSVFTPYISG